jgi:ElaB/YqjD/DUF883 family membrane-anchored ribosome-binding protein
MRTSTHTNTRSKAKHHGNNHQLFADFAKIKKALPHWQANKALRNLKHKGMSIKDHVATYTAEKPWTSLWIAGLTGAVLGAWLLRRK